MSGKAAKAKRRQLAQQQRELATQTFWHGGPDGLTVGDVLLPLATLLGIPETVRSDHALYTEGEWGFVSATTDRILARDYAAKWDRDATLEVIPTYTQGQFQPQHNPWTDTRARGGTLYRVAPIGRVEPDPDYPGAGFRMRSARILEVAETGIPYRIVPSPEALHYIKWTDGSRLYDDDGLALPSPEMRAMGITAKDLAPLGYAPFYMAVQQRAVELLKMRGLL